MSDTRMDDEYLIQRICQSDPAALGLLYDRYGRLVFSLAVTIVGDVGVAEEITQDVFEQIWKKAQLYDHSQSKVSTWLTRITRNRAIDLLRRKNVRPEGHRADFTLDFFEQIKDENILEDTLDSNQEQERLHRAIAGLPIEQRTVLVLAYFDGLSQQQMADRLGEPLGTIKTRIRLALQKLRQALLADSPPSQ